MDFDYDLVVIGAGSGGVGLARRAASYGARVAICEESAYGGTCVHRGCVPKKLLVYASQLREDLHLLPGYGFDAVDPAFHWSRMMAAQNRELERLDGVYRRLLDGSGVTRLEGRAELQDGHTVQIGHQVVTGRYLAIAVGGKAYLPPAPGIEHAVTSNDLFRLPELPRRITLMGSGYIALEFACIFRGLGSEVKVMYRSDLPLPDFDCDVRSALAEELTNKGIQLVPNAHLDELKPGVVRTSQGEWATDLFVNAAGRVPNTEGLQLEKVGVHLGKKGEVLVNELNQTNVPSIYAVGDCTGGVQLTPYAIAKGRALAERLFNPENRDFRFDPLHVPTAVFTQPAVGSVGLTQQEAVCLHPGDVEVYKTRFRPMKYTLPDRQEKVLMKLVVRSSDEVVLGVHMIGHDAPELIQALSVALTCNATKSQFDRTLAVHPTAAEEFVLLREGTRV